MNELQTMIRSHFRVREFVALSQSLIAHFPPCCHHSRRQSSLHHPVYSRTRVELFNALLQLLQPELIKKMSSFYHDPTTTCRLQSTCQDGDLACNNASQVLFINADKQQALLENEIEKIEIPSENTQEPCEGMLFDSEESARTFYDNYATKLGFITRVLSSRKSERDGTVISRGLGCRGDSENHKDESNVTQKGNKSKENCTAMILMKREKPGSWVVRKFVREHNHPLRVSVSVSRRRNTFDEKDKKIQELTAELRLKKRLSGVYKEQLLALMKDVDGHNEHLSLKVQVVRSNLKKLEARNGHI